MLEPRALGRFRGRGHAAAEPKTVRMRSVQQCVKALGIRPRTLKSAWERRPLARNRRLCHVAISQTAGPGAAYEVRTCTGTPPLQRRKQRQLCAHGVVKLYALRSANGDQRRVI